MEYRSFCLQPSRPTRNPVSQCLPHPSVWLCYSPARWGSSVTVLQGGSLISPLLLITHWLFRYVDYHRDSRSQNYQEKCAQGKAALPSALFSWPFLSSSFPPTPGSLFNCWFIVPVSPLHKWADTLIYIFFFLIWRVTCYRHSFILCFFFFFKYLIIHMQAITTHQLVEIFLPRSL